MSPAKEKGKREKEEEAEGGSSSPVGRDKRPKKRQALGRKGPGASAAANRPAGAGGKRNVRCAGRKTGGNQRRTPVRRRRKKRNAQTQSGEGGGAKRGA